MNTTSEPSFDFAVKDFRRIVIKVGSALVVDPKTGLRRAWLESLADDVIELRKNGAEVLVVSSGSISLGRNQSKFLSKDCRLKLAESQAAAAIGQIALCRAFDEIFSQRGVDTGQVLVTIGDTETRRRYLNARATIVTLLEWKAVPIINENDTVATNEIRYGDNDRLAARVATMVDADLLILLSDIDGLYTKPPSSDPTAEHIPLVAKVDERIESMAGEAASNLSRGGMVTKIAAAKIATGGGAAMLIASGKTDHPIAAVRDGGLCTWFAPSDRPVNQRQKWIAGGLGIDGQIEIDSGALAAVKAGKSLLPAGVKSVDGDFKRGDTVEVMLAGIRVACGLVEYDSDDAKKIAGLQSSEIEAVLGENFRVAMIRSDDLVIEPN
jgi:glutamate 5-kinase